MVVWVGRVEGQVGFISRSFDFPFVITNNDGTQAFFIENRQDNFPTGGISFVGDTVLYEEWGPLSGRRFAWSSARILPMAGWRRPP